jgi:hypothetical protein
MLIFKGTAEPASNENETCRLFPSDVTSSSCPLIDDECDPLNEQICSYFVQEGVITAAVVKPAIKP